MLTAYYIFQNNKILHRCNQEGAAPLTQREWQELNCTTAPRITLEAPANGGVFSVEFSKKIPLPPQYRWVSLRNLVGRIPDHLFQKWGKASHLLHWYKTHKYCGSCGDKTVMHPKELARLCPTCSTCSYPTIAPCIIVLVHHKEKILLARSPHFSKKMFSTLAGFIEPGESAEETVIREIHEEVRIRVKNIHYVKSQPWPFPGQLMLGFFAEYESGEIEIDGTEICEAYWYRYDKLPKIPGSSTIAGQLIRHHLSQFDG